MMTHQMTCHVHTCGVHIPWYHHLSSLTQMGCFAVIKKRKKYVNYTRNTEKTIHFNTKLINLEIKLKNY
jgi:hypothetical protein